MKKKSIVSIQTNDIEPENITKIKLIILKSLSNEQTILTLCKTEVYIAYENQEFQNIDLKGIFCIIASRINSNLFIQIYDCNDFNKQLEIELYTNIEYGLTIMNDKFLSIEFPTFFLGFNFTTENSLNEVYNCIIINSTILNSHSNQFSYEKKNKKKFFKNSEIKFDKIETLINFNYDDNNDIIYDISKGANRFLDTLDIGLADLNYEYEIIRTQIQNNKIEKKKIDEENKEKKRENLIEKEKIEKIISELNKLEVVKKESDLEIIKKKNKIKKYKFNNNFYYEKKLYINSNKLIMYSNDNEESSSSESEEDNNSKLKLKHISTSKNKYKKYKLNEENEINIMNKKNKKIQSSFALKNLNNE